jgi:hypothetical protein
MEVNVAKMGKFTIPKTGTPSTAKITRVDLVTAGELFTDKKTGVFKGQYRSKDDKVYVIYGVPKDRNQEVRLGTVNPPENPGGMLLGKKNKLLLLCRALGIEGEIDDSLQVLVGREVAVEIDEGGFVRLSE